MREKFAQRFPQTETMRDLSFNLAAVTNQLQMGTNEGSTPHFPQTLIDLHHPGRNNYLSSALGCFKVRAKANTIAS